MAGALAGIGSALGTGYRGLLDFRQGLINQRNDLLNPLVQQQQQQQAYGAQDQARYLLGGSGQMQGPDGFTTDLGPARGLLADERFADNKSELTFAAGLLGNPQTAQIGSSIINNVLSGQSQLDASQASGAQRHRLDLEKAVLDQQRQQEQDRLALEKEQYTRARNQQQDELGFQQQQFTQEQQLESDYTQALAPAANAVQQYEGLNAALQQRNGLGVVANVFQLAKLIDPNARTVTEGDVQTIEGSFPLASQLNRALAKIQGGGWDETTQQQILALGQALAEPILNQGSRAFSAFEGRIADSPMGLNRGNVIGRHGLDALYGPQGIGIDAFLGERVGSVEQEEAQLFQEARERAEASGLKFGRPVRREDKRRFNQARREGRR